MIITNVVNYTIAITIIARSYTYYYLTYTILLLLLLLLLTFNSSTGRGAHDFSRKLSDLRFAFLIFEIRGTIHNCGETELKRHHDISREIRRPSLTNKNERRRNRHSRDNFPRAFGLTRGATIDTFSSDDPRHFPSCPASSSNPQSLLLSGIIRFAGNFLFHRPLDRRRTDRNFGRVVAFATLHPFIRNNNRERTISRVGLSFNAVTRCCVII